MQQAVRLSHGAICAVLLHLRMAISIITDTNPPLCLEDDALNAEEALDRCRGVVQVRVDVELPLGGGASVSGDSRGALERTAAADATPILGAMAYKLRLLNAPSTCEPAANAAESSRCGRIPGHEKATSELLMDFAAQFRPKDPEPRGPRYTRCVVASIG